MALMLWPDEANIGAITTTSKLIAVKVLPQGTRLKAPIIARTLVERGTRVLFLKQAAVMVHVFTK